MGELKKFSIIFAIGVYVLFHFGIELKACVPLTLHYQVIKAVAYYDV